MPPAAAQPVGQVGPPCLLGQASQAPSPALLLVTGHPHPLNQLLLQGPACPLGTVSGTVCCVPVSVLACACLACATRLLGGSTPCTGIHVTCHMCAQALLSLPSSLHDVHVVALPMQPCPGVVLSCFLFLLRFIVRTAATLLPACLPCCQSCVDIASPVICSHARKWASGGPGRA